jgi:hypothetical protein
MITFYVNFVGNKSISIVVLNKFSLQWSIQKKIRACLMRAGSRSGIIFWIVNTVWLMFLCPIIGLYENFGEV